jgi:hypothetical protein
MPFALACSSTDRAIPLRSDTANLRIVPGNVRPLLAIVKARGYDTHNKPFGFEAARWRACHPTHQRSRGCQAIRPSRSCPEARG